MSRVNRCQPARPFAAFQDKTYEEEGSKGGGEFEDLATRSWGAVNFYCNSLSPFVSFVFDDFILGTRGVYKSLVVCLWWFRFDPFHFWANSG